MGGAILTGTSRDGALRWSASAALDVAEDWLTIRHLLDADEAFLSSSVAGILPVTRFAGQAIGDGRPGEWTLRARSEREAFVAGAAAP